MPHFVKLAVVSVVTFGAATVQSAPLVSLSALGQTTTSVAGTTSIDFDSGCGYASCGGDFQIVLGSVSGEYAQPAGTHTNYLSVPNPRANGSATFGLGQQANYFGLFWGSIDAYNSIAFYDGGDLVSSYSGTDLVGAFADGNQVSFASNRYINFDFGSDTYDTVRLNSNGFAFESDNHAYRAATSVPEPGTLALLGLGLAGLALARRKRAA